MYLELVPSLFEENIKYSIGIIFGMSVIVFISTNIFRKKNIPPGPIGLPIIGYLPFLGYQPHLTLHKLGEKYGPIFSMHLGRKLVVVVSDFELTKEALTSNCIMNRPENPPDEILPDTKNISICNGSIWNEQRKFSIQLLRQLEMANQNLDGQVQKEVQKLLKEINFINNCPVNLNALLFPSFANNMLKLLIGKSFEYDDQESIFLCKTLRIVKIFLRPTALHAYFPWLKFWMIKFNIYSYNEVYYCMKNLFQFLREQIEKHKGTLDLDYTRDYIDGYLRAINSKSLENSSFTEKMLEGNLQSLFVAGSNPSRAALEWSLLAVIQYPEIQKSIHREIDSVLENQQQPCWSHHKKMPFTMAVIYESMRYNTIVPINLRSTSKRTKIAGYDIPEKTIIMTNIWSIHHDSEHWEDPFDFKPERFLKDGEIFKPKAFMPFSYGRRNCPGQAKAIMEIFLYFSSLLQNYEISTVTKNFKFKRELGAAVHVKLDNIIMTPR